MTSWDAWHVPLSRAQLSIREAIESLKAVGAEAQEVPLIVKLVENPRYTIPGLEVFHGAVDLETHDLIHILLGRGLLPKDEAFTIGYTMGSTKCVGAIEETLFGFISKNFYPKFYRFGDDELRIFHDAVRLAQVSECQPLDRLRREHVMDLTIAQARDRFGIEEDLLRAYYRIERRRFPNAAESRRLVD